jgi:hypothetical protein
VGETEGTVPDVGNACHDKIADEVALGNVNSKQLEILMGERPSTPTTRLTPSYVRYMVT